ncbi:hypothetical protein CR513_07105, partial [Mucuna pruriens]
MDILGLFPMAKGQVKFLRVDVDYFTRWIEAELYGLPHLVVTDGSTQFISNSLHEFYEGLGIKHKVSLIEHP